MSALAALASSSSRAGGEPSSKRQRMNHAGGDDTMARYKKNSKEFYAVLLESLKTVWSKIQEQGRTGNSVVEVEVRVGMLVTQGRRFTPQLLLTEQRAIQVAEGSRAGMEFKAGVDECHLHDVKKDLAEHGYEGSEQPVSRLRVNGIGQRWEIGPNGAILSTESKKKFFQSDLALLCHEYDIRVNSAMETQKPASGSESNDAVSDAMSWNQERLKRRISYRSKKSPWRVDLTDVEITHRQPSSQGQYVLTSTRELELEVELDAQATEQWIGTNSELLLEKTTVLAKQLGELLNICIASSTEQGAEKALEQLTLSNYKDSVRKINQALRVASKQEHFMPEFVGAMPVNLTRKNLNIVMRNSYFVTEKTDGVRYLLYAVPDPITGNPVAVVVDRKGSIFSIPGSAAIGQALGVGTVLDGELVYNRTYKKQVFLMFDVLAIGDQPKLQLPFSKRISLIAEEVNNLCRKYLELKPVEGQEDALWLIRKVFRKKTEIHDIVNKLKSEDGARVFYENERRHHKSDGIIFQADNAYQMGTCMELFKWKWLELRSVDLQGVINTHGDLRLFAGGPEGTEIDCMLANTVALAPYDTYRLRADMEEAGLRRPIVEVTYDTMVGTWRYHTMRKDKKEPNKIQTVIGVMLELAESIPIEELEYAFLSNGSNDFAAQIGKMKKQLLDWKKKHAQA